VGVGLALAAQRRGSGQCCFAVVGDGEINESAIWEALLFATHWKLSNLVVASWSMLSGPTGRASPPRLSTARSC
jgi:transketolase N-terminal domain/subunit